jgi:hypothetical protein
MHIVHARCAGLDVHKKTVVVYVRLVQGDGTVTTHTRTFRTMTADVLNLVAWLCSLEVTHIAMESTGEFWKPVYKKRTPFQLVRPHHGARTARLQVAGEAPGCRSVVFYGFLLPKCCCMVHLC